MNAPAVKLPVVELPVVELQGVTKRFGRHEVLKGVDLSVHPAEHLALVANNGQGKTTLIRLILGLLPPDEGSIRIGGELVGFPRATAHKQLVGYLPETITFYPHITGLKTLRFLGRLKGEARGQALEREIGSLLERVGLRDAADERVGRYSKGMRQRLGLAQALLGKPRLLLLDEPTNGLDPDGVHEFYNILESLQADGVSIVMASHLLAEVEPRLDRLAVLRGGRVERLGTIDDLAAQAGLPSTIRFSLRHPEAGLPESLAALTPSPTPNGTPHSFLITVPRADKHRLLEAVVRHAAELETLVVRDPGLEELFRSIVNTPLAPGGEHGEEHVEAPSVVPPGSREETP